MNLRQKYKRTKQQLKRYKNITTKPLYIRDEKQVETLRATYTIPPFDMDNMRVDLVESSIRDILSEQLSDCIKDRMILTKDCSMVYGVKYTAEIKIVI